jgi:hypothetical protein
MIAQLQISVPLNMWQAEYRASVQQIAAQCRGRVFCSVSFAESCTFKQTHKETTNVVYTSFVPMIYFVLSVFQVRWEILYQTTHHLGDVSDQRIVSTDRLT